MNATTIVAALTWQEASVSVAGIVLAAVVVWQVFATGRTAVSSSGDTGYKRIAEQVNEQGAANNDLLERIADDLSDVRTRLAEVERVLKDV